MSEKRQPAGWEYSAWLGPSPAPGATSPICDDRDVVAFLNQMDRHGWEYVSTAHQFWNDNTPTQTWWIFRRRRAQEASNE